ncbi:hypothetical protein V1523DRAFT_399768 [Lipomyces doorenjongii]
MLRDPPVTLPRKGRARGTTSAEIVQQGADSVESVRRCRLCKRTGHNKRTCPRALTLSMANDAGEGSLPVHSIGEDGNKEEETGSGEDGEDSMDDEDVEFAEMWAGILP